MQFVHWWVIRRFDPTDPADHTPGTPASSSGSSHAATTSTEHVTQVAETINRLEHTVTNLNLLERAAIDRAYTRHTTTTRAFIGQVLGKCFEARAFLIMNPQVAFGAPDGWPAYSRTTHGTWALAGVLQDIQPNRLCYCADKLTHGHTDRRRHRQY